MAFSFQSLLEFGLEQSAEVFTRGFSDYFVKIAASPAMLLQMGRVDSVDLTLSKIVLRDGTALGAALIARRGWTCRLAGMAIVPEGRRLGAGRALVNHVLAEAGARGDRAMVLEVIEQNEPAVRLYDASGFRRVRRLVGFSRSAEVSPEIEPRAAELEEMDVRAVAAKITGAGFANLPWQLSGETVAQLTPPHRAFRLGDAGLVVSSVDTSPVGVRAVVADNLAEDPECGAALLRAMVAKFPGKDWRIGALWPEELAAVFLSAGFVRTPLSQWQMERSTAAP